mgnify:CR=1 FL=1
MQLACDADYLVHVACRDVADLEAELDAGEPDVRAARTENTSYVEQRWTHSPELLREAAVRGSVCSRILLEAEGVPY